MRRILNSITPPTQLADDPPIGTVAFVSRANTSISINHSVSGSDGSNTTGLIVVVKSDADNSDVILPQDGVSYNANSSFGAGDNLGGGCYVVKTTTTLSGSLTITGLSSNTWYKITVFTYKEDGSDVTTRKYNNKIVFHSTTGATDYNQIRRQTSR